MYHNEFQFDIKSSSQFAVFITLYTLPIHNIHTLYTIQHQKEYTASTIQEILTQHILRKYTLCNQEYSFNSVDTALLVNKFLFFAMNSFYTKIEIREHKSNVFTK